MLINVLFFSQVLLRLKQICALENVSYDESGLEAIIFTAEGDMRNALNALQSTVSGFSFVTAENVFKVDFSLKGNILHSFLMSIFWVRFRYRFAMCHTQ